MLRGAFQDGPPLGLYVKGKGKRCHFYLAGSPFLRAYSVGKIQFAPIGTFQLVQDFVHPLHVRLGEPQSKLRKAQLGDIPKQK